MGNGTRTGITKESSIYLNAIELLFGPEPAI
jgi:hypothetical protein